ncbi:hypothetical protein H634G_04157 [Metarhizium anisopliae BRIP 53293]|uniref:Uncharacterized protein n=1 Tax=Metarhizium anisopliae BRIP 53293 TaxID=1291518 RepID=A0A0D9P1D9_METAN|nr:hypothetical protein H634G_04157 [Metarhizium anisopliae BRIP 53293]KJK95921.1 hypothetical protein H633G_00270 [Metarhizium anisopliae BRIP 53284]
MSASRPSHPPPSWNGEVDKVKEARSRGDAAAAITTANAAADNIESHVGETMAGSADENEALTAAQRFTFNVAADAWPGWQRDGPLPDKPTLLRAKRLAQRSASLVDRLKLGPVQVGTGAWLVGAFDLVLGNFEEALARFSAASDNYHAASAPGLELLTSGYAVMARGLWASKSEDDIAGDLDRVIAQILAGSFEDGEEWAEQLRTALAVVSRKEYREIWS